MESHGDFTLRSAMMRRVRKRGWKRNTNNKIEPKKNLLQYAIHASNLQLQTLMSAPTFRFYRVLQKILTVFKMK